MNILIKNLKSLIITSHYGERTRNGLKEFHPGIDVRVVDEKYNPYPILAPENMIIKKVVFDKTWGHAIYSVPIDENDLGVDEFRFWHVKPYDACKAGAVFNAGDEIGTPEKGYVPLHLHFECRSGGKTINPVEYLKLRNQKFI